MKLTKKAILFVLFVLAVLGLAFPAQAKAFSFQQTFSPAVSFLTAVGERVQYVFAFTPAGRVVVLANQAQKRLVVAQTEPDKAENLIKEYGEIKNKQNTLLNKVDDNTLKRVQEQTQAEQKILAKIGNDQPETVETVKAVNTAVVGAIKNTLTLKEGTTAGEAFEEKATITFAPGTSGVGTGTLIIEGGAQKFAPGTSGTGQGTQTIQGGGQQYAPGTSAGGEGGTKIEGGNPGFAPGTSSGGESGTKVEGNNPGVAPGTSSGGEAGQKVVGE